jgi:hypothetical protein
MNTKSQAFHTVLSHAIWYLLCDSLYKSLKGQLQELILLFLRVVFALSSERGIYGTPFVQLLRKRNFIYVACCSDKRHSDVYKLSCIVRPCSLNQHKPVDRPSPTDLRWGGSCLQTSAVRPLNQKKMCSGCKGRLEMPRNLHLGCYPELGTFHLACLFNRRKHKDLQGRKVNRPFSHIVQGGWHCAIVVFLTAKKR